MVIFGLVLLAGMFLLGAVLGLIPEFTAFDPSLDWAADGTAWGNMLDHMAAVLATWDLFIPVSVTFACIAAIIGAKILVAVVHLLQWVYDRIPFKAS